MAGLNFYTQTIINSNSDPDSGKELFKAESGHLKIRRDFDFYKDKAGYGKVVAARKKLGHSFKKCKATIDFSTLNLAPSEGVKFCRLDIYLGVEGAEPFIYSTPWVSKGMPFWVEFSVKAGESAADVAADVEKIIKSNHIFLCDKDLINVSVSENSLILEGASEFQRFKQVEISECLADDIYPIKVAELGQAGITLNERGVNGFGTYSQIIKDLRLPTAANWQPYHVRQVETPVIGAIYDQYIIEYAAPATNEGLAAVGQKLESTTTHVFWVKKDVVEAFDAAIATSTIKVDTTAPEAGEAGAPVVMKKVSESKK